MRAEAASRHLNGVNLESIRLYYGFDPREAVGAHVWLQSVIERSSLPVEAVALTPRIGEELGITSDATNSFGKIRFAVPYLAGFKGFAIFADGADMLLRADLAELWEQRNGWHALQVVPHDYKTKAPRKYIGTELEADNADYPKKNQSSLMIFNCSHYLNQRHLTPENIRKQTSGYLHRFEWLDADRIAHLDPKWNHLVAEREFDPEAKIAHFTLGISGFSHYQNCDYSDEWKSTLLDSMRGMQYEIQFKR